MFRIPSSQASRLLAAQIYSGQPFRLLRDNGAAAAANIQRNHEVDTKTTLNFTDPKAYKSRQIKELIRALVVLSVSSNQMFSKNSLKIFNVTKAALGERLVNILMRPGFYNQFVSAANVKSLQPIADRLAEANINLQLCIALEACTSSEEAARSYDLIVLTTKALSQLRTNHRNMQFRMSAVFPIQILEKISALNEDAQNRFTLVAAQSIQRPSGKRDKPSLDGFGLDQKEAKDVRQGLQYLQVIGSMVQKAGIVLLVDAEHSWINDGITSLTMAFALAFNKDYGHIWNTYQCYLKVTAENIRRDMEFYHKHNIHFGAKIVRGAYIVPETEYAKQNSIPNRVHDSYDNTSKSYNETSEYLLQEVLAHGEKTRFMLASHNQESILQCIRRMSETGLDCNRNKISFGQLYGMCDHISYLIGYSGFPVFKSIAVGTVTETLPYLSRRSQENTSVISNAQQERYLLRRELAARLLPWRW